MKNLSTGEPSTLKTYRQIAVAMGGEDTAATKFFDNKIKESTKGEDEVVIAEESQMMYLIVTMLANEGDAS